MHRAPRRSRAVWFQLAFAALIAAVAVLAPQFAVTDLSENTSIRNVATSASTDAVGDELHAGIGTASTKGAAYSVVKVRLESGKTVDARWNPCQSAVTYRVNLSGLPKNKRAAMLKMVQASFKKLHVATGLTYRYAGTTSFVPKQGNLTEQPAEIVVAAVAKRSTDFPMTDQSLGYGGVLWSTWHGTEGEGAAVMRGYVVLEAGAIQKLKGGWGGGLRQSNVVLHELGHASGLDHAGSRKQQMYPTLTAASPSGFAQGDLAGLAKVGGKAGCIDVPSFVSIPDLR